MELIDIFGLSGDELRTLVHQHIVQYDQFKPIILSAKKDSSDITEFSVIDIYPVSQIGGAVQVPGAVVMRTEPFIIQENDEPIETRVFVYIADSNKFVVCPGLGEKDIYYSYDEQRKVTADSSEDRLSASLIGPDRRFFSSPSYLPKRRDLVVPCSLYTGKTDQNEWMMLNSVARSDSLLDKQTKYLIFYINPKTLGK